MILFIESKRTQNTSYHYRGFLCLRLCVCVFVCTIYFTNFALRLYIPNVLIDDDQKGVEKNLETSMSQIINPFNDLKYHGASTLITTVLNFNKGKKCFWSSKGILFLAR